MIRNNLGETRKSGAEDKTLKLVKEILAVASFF